MGVSLVVAVTDSEWFDVLRQEPDLPEVNFWAPSPKNFKALRPGELFLFKLKAPRNVIAGGGVYTHASTLPCSLAWEAFGMANGTRSVSQLREHIARYRSAGADSRSDFKIGCRILTQPFFFEKRDWFPVPKNWSPNIVSLKRYNTDEPEGRGLWDAVMTRLAPRPGFDQALPGARYGKPQVIEPRLGQGAFRAMVTDVYRRRCAVTRERTLPALDAAHIRPYGEGGEHELKNGLLLRGDLHRLFDAGYVTVTPAMDFEVSPRIREEFENGRDYYALHGKRIDKPDPIIARPDPKALAWHNEHRFL